MFAKDKFLEEGQGILVVGMGTVEQGATTLVAVANGYLVHDGGEHHMDRYCLGSCWGKAGVVSHSPNLRLSVGIQEQGGDGVRRYQLHKGGLVDQHCVWVDGTHVPDGVLVEFVVGRQLGCFDRVVAHGDLDEG